ncbi:MAG: hypothetical protein F6K41_04990 [Symploca sp. SIO3E6]|nr:hypothetical protein [Caldora sp. SIO3E6]
MGRRRRTRQRQWFRSLKKLVQKILRWLGLGRSSRQSPNVPPTRRSTLPEQQRSIQQTIGNVDLGSVVVGSIANVQGDVYVAVRPSTGMPFQVPPLPTYYVDRTTTRERIKRNLLRQGTAQDRTLVVSAVYGLGGIGKSVLATALAFDREVQKHFPDGVLWATLGQHPEILSFLGNWIQALRDFDYKPTTIEAASIHLRSLLYNKRMLLVVDDAWRSEDVEWFRIGGAGCQILVTTREAHIPGAERVDLDQMDQNEAISLLEGYLRKTLTDYERELALQLADAVGYLPLALELAAVQVEDGASWKQLLVAFEEEVARLEVLDSPDLEEVTTEKARKQRSLRASFNLSLQRLKLEFLHRFAEMGVLPEDVNVGAGAMATIWGVSLEIAQKSLRELRRRSLLLDGVAWNEEPTYRMHDLVHDTARLLLKDLLGLTSAEAHCLVVERYKALLSGKPWWALLPDGYIHANLTWHMEQAGLADEIHQLLAASNERGRNAWFEACNSLGEPALFVKDIVRGWQLAEAMYVQEQELAIVLQVRYALVVTTLNSLASNIPLELMIELVKHEFWTVEQAWAYVEQIKEDKKRIEAIPALAPYFSKSLTQRAISLVQQIQDDYTRYWLLGSVSPDVVTKKFCTQLLAQAERVENEYTRADILAKLARYLPDNLWSTLLTLIQQMGQAKSTILPCIIPYAPEEYLAKILRIAQETREEYLLEEIIEKLAPYLTEDLVPKAIRAAKQMQEDKRRKSALSSLAAYLSEKELLKLIKEIEIFRTQIDTSNIYSLCSDFLKKITANVPENFLPILFKIVQKIHIYDRQVTGFNMHNSKALGNLAERLPSSFAPEILEMTADLDNESGRILVLEKLAPNLPEELLSGVLQILESVRSKFTKFKVLSKLPKPQTDLLLEALEDAHKVADEYQRIETLLELVPYAPQEIAPKALEIAAYISDEHNYAYFLSQLAQFLPEELLSQIIALAREIWNPSNRIYVLNSLIQNQSKNLITEVLEESQYIWNLSSRAELLSNLAQNKAEALRQTIKLSQQIENLSIRANILSKIAQYHPTVYYLIIEIVHQIDDEFTQAEILCNVVSNLPDELLPNVLEIAQRIGNAYRRASVLSKLAQRKPGYYVEALEATQLILGEASRSEILSSLVPSLPEELLQPAFKITQQIWDLFSRVQVLIQFTRRQPELLSTTLALIKEIPDIFPRIEALGSLAKDSELPLDEAILDILTAVQQIKDETQRISVLGYCAEYLPDKYIAAMYEICNGFSSLHNQASAVSQLISRFPLSTYTIDEWQSLLHLLAHRNRSTFLQDLPKLTPAIQNLSGSTTTISAIVEAMEEICRQWK